MKCWALIQGGRIANVIKQDAMPATPGVWKDVTGKHVGPGFTDNGNDTYAEPSYKDINNAPILAAIAALEAGQARGIRECLLTGDKTGLQLVDDKVKALRAKLEK